VPEAVLKVEELSCGFHTEGGFQRIVDKVSFEVAAGETLGIVGESGCGKTVSALSIMGLLPRPAGVVEEGRIYLDGRDLAAANPEELRSVRGRRIAMIFQEPMTALNPVQTIGRQIAESLTLNEPGSDGATIVRRSVDRLEQVGRSAPQQRHKDYTHPR
jgi:ABC-type dipeptide/oligopeptide/nickel transport system ATPase component